MAFSLGWYGWPSVIGAAVIDFSTWWPSECLISRRIKRQDAGWDEKRVDRIDKGIPGPDAPEV